MFVATVPALPYADPWQAPLQNRLQMLANGERRVAYYAEEPNTSTFRYRAYNMAQVLNSQAGNRYAASWFFRPDLGSEREIAARADMLVVCRSGYEHRLVRLMDLFSRLGKPVLFDIDDLVFDTRYVHLLISALGLNKDDPRVWDDWFGLAARMGATLSRCDGAITTNDVLAGHLREISGRPVAVVPNFMNREQLDISDRLWAAKEASGFAVDGHPTLGYFSGTPSHQLDYAIAEPAIARLMERQSALRLMLVGFIAPGPALGRFSDRILRLPFTDWVNLQRAIATVEVNLMPLQASAFADCKSPLKYFEAAAVGTVSVASPTANHVASIIDGHNGRLARSPEWERQIESVLQGGPACAAMATNARADALSRHSWAQQFPALQRALGWN